MRDCGRTPLLWGRLKAIVIEVLPMRRRRGICLPFVDPANSPARGRVEVCSVRVYPHADTQQGSQLRLARQRAGLTIGELALELEISATSLLAMERGSRTMPEDQWREVFLSLHARALSGVDRSHFSGALRMEANVGKDMAASWEK